MPEGTLKPEEVANLDPYKRRQKGVSSKAQELLTGAGPIPEASEDFGEIQRFSKETRRALEEKGFEIYELTGQTILTLRDQGNKFWSKWHKRYPDLEALPSIKSEVAINPNELFIGDSNNKTFSDQEAMLKIWGAAFSSLVPGTEVIMGEAPDYVELAFKSPSDRRLFGEKYDYTYTSTKTQVDSYVAIVGDYSPADGLKVYNWDSGYRNGLVFVAPLVVPAGNK